jgi:hypothetical protein
VSLDAKDQCWVCDLSNVAIVRASRTKQRGKTSDVRRGKAHKSRAMTDCEWAGTQDLSAYEARQGKLGVISRLRRRPVRDGSASLRTIGPRNVAWQAIAQTYPGLPGELQQGVSIDIPRVAPVMRS